MDTLTPRWKKFDISVRTLCNGDYERDLKFVCFDWNLSGDHSLIGEFHATLKSLSIPNATFKCINGKKKVNCYLNKKFLYRASCLDP